MTVDLLPDGWDIEFRCDGHPASQYQAILLLDGVQRCRLSLANHDLTQEAAEMHLRTRAVQWVTDYSRRRPQPGVSAQPCQADHGA